MSGGEPRWPPLAGARGTGSRRARAGLAARGARLTGLRNDEEDNVARVIVDVMLKPEIHDPQGEAIASASKRLGFGQVSAIRQGKRFEVEISGPADEAALAEISKLAGELLANPVSEEFSLRAG
jgi:phosphoribosylformylglycinamidine synthase subunit PurS